MGICSNKKTDRNNLKTVFVIDTVFFIEKIPQDANILRFYTKVVLHFGGRVIFFEINLRDSSFFCTFSADFQIVTT